MSTKLVNWLESATELGMLPRDVLESIAGELEVLSVPAGCRVTVEDTPVTKLYILESGQAERYRRQRAGLMWATGLLPGAVVNLSALQRSQLTDSRIVTITECQFQTIAADRWLALVAKYPQITAAYAERLAGKLEQLEGEIAYDRDRQAALRTYLVPQAKRGIIGESRYAVKLRQQIRAAASDDRSVIISGEPGLEKDNIAALIHFGSKRRQQPVISLKSALITANGAELFGRVGGKPGLLEWLGEGTLILNDVQELPRELVPQIEQLLTTGNYTPIDREGQASLPPRASNARLILISESTQPTFNKVVKHQIKVPGLRVRKADLEAHVNYYLNIICRQKKLPKPQVTPEAIRRLQAYDFPGNLKELQGMVDRALLQAQGSKVLTEEVFWAQAAKKQLFRLNLLNAYPRLRQFLNSDWYPDRINYGFTAWVFPIVVAILFLAPQDRQHNFALNLFWAWWWPLILLLFPIIGRLWCAFCPFMIYGEIVQKLSLKFFPRTLKKWPRETAEKWGGWFLFGLFVLIFLWEELWNLENTAYLSSWLLLLITGGAVLFSLIFERRFWCRYLCPIGGMNGLFAKLSIVELRAQQGTCAAECTTYHCYKGGVGFGEGQTTNGCPIYSHPAQLTDNKDCVLCMTCLKACPHRSVELNLRPPGIELWTTHIPHAYEVALLFLLLGGIYLHRLPQINSLLGLQIDLTQFLPHLGLSIAAILLPTTIPFLAYIAMQGLYKLGNLEIIPFKFRKPLPFIDLAYGYLPLILGGNLAHYFKLGLAEGGQIIPITFATFGLTGNNLPSFVAHPAVITFLQGITLVLALLTTFFLTQKIAKRPMRSIVPQHLASICLVVTLWIAIVGK
ncbi:sigma 54-interacting transcriptional regulator [Chamaesiphon minutus]|uniref:Transcriptional regulators containing an AAA-type ATPase domain and a DNA-binding domain n=1 Tax=Chamaesiphon minutus (strain ATCC 27169 / PCC 6605) TaxID=1173020 RepID=K9UHD0_CHAP6|nr:sigma 54-interacting transcriptional regulator [Chamaesiphon minutus]AFY94053.1 transcriptional regulators containing an AAA-type ATPase domain and a DNA-binding domain [Chamaesiphon minutus PCC 6605]